MIPRPTFSGLAIVPLTAALASCGASPPPARAPELPTDKQTRCAVTKSQARPLIVEWPSADRATLEARIRKGVVPVRYAGCEMEVLDQCTLPGEYSYSALTRQRESLSVRDVDDLWAKLPLGAASLEGTLKSAGELNLDMTMVGRYEWSGAPRYGDLQGRCEQATHVITGLIVGAFHFTSGTDSEAGAGAGLAGIGAGTRSRSTRRTINQAGEERECEVSTTKDREPPNGCGAMLRVEVSPILDAPAAAGEHSPIADRPTADESPSAPAVQPAAPAQPPVPAPGRLVVSGSTVRDTRTGLSWQRSVPDSTMSYWDADRYCERLVLSQRERGPAANLLAQEAAPPSRGEGWRLPTSRELRAFGGADPAMRGTFWAAASEDSSGWLRPRVTPLPGNPIAQVALSFFVADMPGGVVREVSSTAGKYRVRCVR